VYHTPILGFILKKIIDINILDLNIRNIFKNIDFNSLKEKKIENNEKEKIENEKIENEEKKVQNKKSKKKKKKIDCLESNLFMLRIFEKEEKLFIQFFDNNFSDIEVSGPINENEYIFKIGFKEDLEKLDGVKIIFDNYTKSLDWKFFLPDNFYSCPGDSIGFNKKNDNIVKWEFTFDKKTNKKKKFI
jgi:hypothetical protein